MSTKTLKNIFEAVIDVMVEKNNKKFPKRVLDENDPTDIYVLNTVKELRTKYGKNINKDHWARLYLDHPEEVDDTDLWTCIRLDLEDEFGQ